MNEKVNARLEKLQEELLKRGDSVAKLNYITLSACKSSTNIDLVDMGFITVEQMASMQPVEFVKLVEDKLEEVLNLITSARGKIKEAEIRPAKLSVLRRNPLLNVWTFVDDKFDTLEDANEYCDNQVKSTVYSAKDLKVVIEVEQ